MDYWRGASFKTWSYVPAMAQIGTWPHRIPAFKLGWAPVLYSTIECGLSGELILISNTPNDVWSSCDGQVWTKSAASDDLPACFSHTSIAADGKMWVLGGIGNDLEDVNNLAWSIDGATWIRFPQSMTQTLPFFPYSQSAAMVFRQ